MFDYFIKMSILYIMKKNNGFKTIGDVFKNVQNKPVKKPPAYKWQDLALIIISELNIPNNKKSSVFKVCRDNNKIFIERCLNDTKELCKKDEMWKYFFKLVSQKGKRTYQN